MEKINFVPKIKYSELDLKPGEWFCSKSKVNPAKCISRFYKQKFLAEYEIKEIPEGFAIRKINKACM